MNLKKKILGIVSIISISTAIVGFAPVYQSFADCAILPPSLCRDNLSRNDQVDSSGIWHIFKMVLKALTAIIGLIAIASIIVAGLIYATAQDSSEKVALAKKIIMNTIAGVILYALLLPITNWLIPGGIFN